MAELGHPPPITTRGGIGRLRADPRIPSSSPSGEDDVSRLVGQVYDAALGDQDWSEVVRRLCRMLGGASATLHRSRSPAQPDIAVRYNADPAYVALYNAHYHRTFKRVPDLSRLRAEPAFIHHMVVPEAADIQTEYYNDYVRPQGLHGSMVWVDVDHHDRRAHLTLWRQRQQPAWDEHQLRILRAIGPHVGQALEIERRLAPVVRRPAAVMAAEVLAPQERACLAGVARGASSKQIGRLLDLSMHTVNAYLASAKRKLKAASRSEAVAMALSGGLIDG
ncbi:response regulator transcription factor [Inquilinus sp. CA228]|uniref:helix-turn-helix transcriptional regulator n=1 Tax=Inquilinus sp. CA228 TaxID=3455609 RepID=UPI003F8D1020